MKTGRYLLYAHLGVLNKPSAIVFNSARGIISKDDTYGKKVDPQRHDSVFEVLRRKKKVRIESVICIIVPVSPLNSLCAVPYLKWGFVGNNFKENDLVCSMSNGICGPGSSFGGLDCFKMLRE